MTSLTSSTSYPALAKNEGYKSLMICLNDAQEFIDKHPEEEREASGPNGVAFTAVLIFGGFFGCTTGLIGGVVMAALTGVMYGNEENGVRRNLANKAFVMHDILTKSLRIINAYAQKRLGNETLEQKQLRSKLEDEFITYAKDRKYIFELSISEPKKYYEDCVVFANLACREDEKALNVRVRAVFFIALTMIDQSKISFGAAESKTSLQWYKKFDESLGNLAESFAGEHYNMSRLQSLNY